MPLIDSGAALFVGLASEFCEMAPASRLTTHLADAFRRRWGRVGESEVRAWRASLTALASVASSAGLDTAGVGVELKLPLTDRRVDAFFVGRSAAGQDTVQLIELKQWDSAAPSQYPDNVVVGGMEHLHPSVQAASYAEYLRASHSAFTENGLQLDACAYLHNMPADEAGSLRGMRYEGATTDAPLFVGGDEEELAAALGASVGSRPWNEKAPDQWKGKRKGTSPRPDRHPYVLWATQPERVREVGCIYSAQGFEFDYFGVILGNDLVWREGIGWVASRDASHDPGIRRAKLSQGEILALLQQTYRVLFTRGMMGTFVYSTDWETLQMFKRLVSADGRPA